MAATYCNRELRCYIAYPLTCMLHNLSSIIMVQIKLNICAKYYAMYRIAGKFGGH